MLGFLWKSQAASFLNPRLGFIIIPWEKLTPANGNEKMTVNRVSGDTPPGFLTLLPCSRVFPPWNPYQRMKSCSAVVLLLVAPGIVW